MSRIADFTRRAAPVAPDASRVVMRRAVTLRRAARVFGLLAAALLVAGTGSRLFLTVGAPTPDTLAGPEIAAGLGCVIVALLLWLAALRARGPGWPRRLARDVGAGLRRAGLLVLAAGPGMGIAAVVRVGAEAQAWDWNWVLLAAPGYIALSVGRCGLVAVALLALARLLALLAPPGAEA